MANAIIVNWKYNLQLLGLIKFVVFPMKCKTRIQSVVYNLAMIIIRGINFWRAMRKKKRKTHLMTLINVLKTGWIKDNKRRKHVSNAGNQFRFCANQAWNTQSIYCCYVSFLSLWLDISCSVRQWWDGLKLFIFSFIEFSCCYLSCLSKKRPIGFRSLENNTWRVRKQRRYFESAKECYSLQDIICVKWTKVFAQSINLFS